MATSTETGSLILKVDSTDVTKGEAALDKLTESAEGASKSVDKLAESAVKAEAAAASLAATTKDGGAAISDVDKAASAASDKIKVMYSPQIVQSARSFREQQQEIITGLLGYGAAVDRVAAKSNTQADISARGAALMAAETRTRQAATIGVAEQTGALSKLLGQIDPTVAGYERLDAMQAKLAAFKTSGAISGDDYALFSGKVAQMRGEVDKAGHSMDGLSLNSSLARRELGRLGADLATGNYGRLAQTSLTLANYTGLMGKAFSATGIAVLGVTAIIGGFTASLYQATEADAALQKSIILSGNASGQTAEQMKVMASGYATVFTSASKVLDLQKGLLETGSVNARTFRDATQAAISFGEATGQSQEDVIKTFDELAKDPVSTLEKINQLYGWITPAVLDHVKALADQGDKANAVAEAFRAINDSASDTASAEEKASTTIDHLIAKWKSGASEISGYYQKLVNGISPTEEFQIARSTYELHLQSSKRNSPLDRLSGQVYTPEQLRAEEASMREMAATIKAQRDVAALGAQTTDDNKTGTSANSYYDNHFSTLTKVAKKQKELNDLTATYEQMWEHTDSGNARLNGVQRVVGADGKVSFSGGNFDRDVAAVNNKFSGPARKAAPDLSINDTNEYLSQLTDGYKKELTAQANATIGVAQYSASLDKQNEALQRSIQSQIDKIGMGDREYQQQQQINDIYIKSADALTQLQLKRASVAAKGGDTTEFDQDIAILQSNTDKQIAIVTKGYSDMDAARSDWTNGLRSSLANYLDQAGDAAGQSAEAFTNAFTGMGNALTSFVTTGKGDFKGFVSSVLTDIARMEVKAAESKILGALIPMISGAFGYDVTGGAGSSNFNSDGFVSHVNFNAKGGIYSSPSLSAYSGQVVNQPTPFRFAAGAGIMGEAGPEAIMPLSRGGDGKLGVKMQGGGGEISVSTVVNIDSSGNASSSTTSNDDSARQLGNMVTSKVKEVMIKESRPGGMLWKMQH